MFCLVYFGKKKKHKIKNYFLKRTKKQKWVVVILPRTFFFLFFFGFCSKGLKCTTDMWERPSGMKKWQLRSHYLSRPHLGPLVLLSPAVSQVGLLQSDKDYSVKRWNSHDGPFNSREKKEKGKQPEALWGSPLMMCPLYSSHSNSDLTLLHHHFICLQ